MRKSTCLATAVATLLAVSAGCATEGDAFGDEDAAAASVDGKSDGSTFALGPYMNGSYDEGTPLLAHFHAPGGQPDGETGLVDYVDYAADEARYVAGSFKVYKYRGRDRLRITDDEGRVVLRTDWSYADNRLTLGEAELYQPRQLPEELVSCLAVDVLDYGWFEESLTEWEYPNVSVDREGTAMSFSIGGSSYTEEDGATFSLARSLDVFEAVAALDGYKVTVRVPNAGPRRGQILVQEDGGEPRAIATIVCR